MSAPLKIPELSLVVLIGASGSGKSTFAQKHFKATEILSSDFFRGLVSDDENSQTATPDAFETLHFVASKRLAAGKLTVIDATNVKIEARRPLVALARQYHCLPVAIVLNISEDICQERNRHRADRDFGPHVIRQQSQQLRRSLRGLQREGFRHIHVLNGVREIEEATFVREKLYNNRREERGPFDIIGDVHGCYEELVKLLEGLGYRVAASPAEGAIPPEGRKALFLGDLVDRGPRIPDVLRLVMCMVRQGHALCVPGNHDIRLMRKLRGKDVQVTHGLAESIAQLETETPEFRNSTAEFLDDLVSHYVLDEGRLVVAHAGMKEEMQGRGSGKVRDFALYGETTGETDEFGLPVRYNWAAEYRGRSIVVYGHTPVPEPEWLNRTINIDTGCVFGGKLTALRYPEKELVSVPAGDVYCSPVRPLHPATEAPALSAQHREDELLHIEDVIGKRIISTRLRHNVTIREENSAAALEVMSRFAANPKWLIYLPPTMSPPATSKLADFLEHPAEAFSYFRQEGIGQVICQEKHMGSRAVLIVCRDLDSARKNFGVLKELGICYTRTGRRFFDNPEAESSFIERARAALSRAGIWERLQTDWVCLDCELMPWSAKAQELLRRQYAPVGATGRSALRATTSELKAASSRGVDVADLSMRVEARQRAVEQFITSYENYCWRVQSLDDLRIAPFHVLASEGKVHASQDHRWHMDLITELSAADPNWITTTRHVQVDVTDARSESEATDWWLQLTASGGEGMVVKPLSFIARGRRDLAQPAVKCRGREYLRIIYGPEYDLPENLTRLRERGLGAKRSLALREFALGIEGLHRFVSHEPLRRVHECVFGVLALESEPVDPRL